MGLRIEMIHAGLLPLEEGNALFEQMINDGCRSPCLHVDEPI